MRLLLDPPSEKHLIRHKACYYRPSCAKCWFKAVFQILIIRIKLGA